MCVCLEIVFVCRCMCECQGCLFWLSTSINFLVAAFLFYILVSKSQCLCVCVFVLSYCVSLFKMHEQILTSEVSNQIVSQNFYTHPRSTSPHQSNLPCFQSMLTNPHTHTCLHYIPPTVITIKGRLLDSWLVYWLLSLCNMDSARRTSLWTFEPLP